MRDHCIAEFVNIRRIPKDLSAAFKRQGSDLVARGHGRRCDRTQADVLTVYAIVQSFGLAVGIHQ
jgi:hypothetical protein